MADKYTETFIRDQFNRLENAAQRHEWDAVIAVLESWSDGLSVESGDARIKLLREKIISVIAYVKEIQAVAV